MNEQAYFFLEKAREYSGKAQVLRNEAKRWPALDCTGLLDAANRWDRLSDIAHNQAKTLFTPRKRLTSLIQRYK